MTDGGWSRQPQALSLGPGQLWSRGYTPGYLCGGWLKLLIWDIDWNSLPALPSPASPTDLMVSPRKLINPLHIDSHLKVCFWVLGRKTVNLKITSKICLFASSLIWWKIYLSLNFKLYTSQFWGFIFAIQVVTQFHALYFIHNLLSSIPNMHMIQKP